MSSFDTSGRHYGLAHPGRSPIDERIKKLADWNVAEVREGVKSGHEFGLHLGKRQLPTCQQDCGRELDDDCFIAIGDRVAAAMASPTGQVCSLNNGPLAPDGTLVRGCYVQFSAHEAETQDLLCISNVDLAELAVEVFNDFVQPYGIGGCIDSPDTGHVCIANSILTTCF